MKGSLHTVPALLRRPIQTGVLALAALSLVACDETAPTNASALKIVDGDAQVDTVFAPLRVPLTVKAENQGNGVKGEKVVFRSVGGSQEIEVTTDATGTASTPWSLSGTPGPQTVEAFIRGKESISQTFTLDAKEGIVYLSLPDTAAVGQVTGEVKVSLHRLGVPRGLVSLNLGFDSKQIGVVSVTPRSDRLDLVSERSNATSTEGKHVLSAMRPANDRFNETPFTVAFSVKPGVKGNVEVRLTADHLVSAGTLGNLLDRVHVVGDVIHIR